MHEPTMHEHRRDEIEIHRQRRIVEHYPRGLTCERIDNDLRAGEIDTVSYLFRNKRERIVEGLVGSKLLKQHEDEYVETDDRVIYDRCDRAVGIVVTDREHVKPS